MNTLEDKLNYLKGINNTIISLESDIIEMQSQNQTLSKLKIELEHNIKEINQKNEDLIASNNAISNEYNQLTDIKNEILDPNYSANNENHIRLGINNLTVRNSEAIHDALSHFDKKCPYCKEYLFVTTNRKQFEVDHFFPVAKGGQDVPWNLLPVCQNCNRKKKDILPHIFLDFNSFKEVSNYLKGIHQNYLNESIDSYTLKNKLIELIEKESNFIKNNLRSEFISTLLYLTEVHNLINEDKVFLTQNEYIETDGNTDRIIKYLNKELPEDWDNFQLIKRRSFLESQVCIDDNSQNLHQRKYVCIAEIWCECLGKKKEDMDRYNTRDINSIMKKLNDWTQSTSTKNFTIYGKQKFYERKSTMYYKR